MLFVNENFNRVRTELSNQDGQGVPSFSSIAKAHDAMGCHTHILTKHGHHGHVLGSFFLNP